MTPPPPLDDATPTPDPDPPPTPALPDPLPDGLDAWVRLGRVTGHAPSVCSECGFVSMLAVVVGSTRRGRASTPWPRCTGTPRCRGRRVIPEDAFVGVAGYTDRMARRDVTSRNA